LTLFFVEQTRRTAADSIEKQLVAIVAGIYGKEQLLIVLKNSWWL
jgi:hypothetical protein